MPHITVTLGGPEVSYNAKESLIENKSIDFVLVGEGEKVLLNFLTNENKNQKGVAF